MNTHDFKGENKGTEIRLKIGFMNSHDWGYRSAVQGTYCATAKRAHSSKI